MMMFFVNIITFSRLTNATQATELILQTVIKVTNHPKSTLNFKTNVTAV